MMIQSGRALSALAFLLIATASSSQGGQPVVVSEDDPPRLFIFPGRDNVRPELTSVEEGVTFDANGDGVRERLAWTKPGTGDAFLTVDLNANGKVDSGRELLGNTWRGPAAQRVTGPVAMILVQGFSLDIANTNAAKGAWIDSQDQVYEKLRLWRDQNQNGISEQDELAALASANITAVNTGYQVVAEPSSNQSMILMHGVYMVGKEKDRANERRYYYVQLARR
jgi:hypothetical protein